MNTDRQNFGKATLTVNGNDVHMSMPFAKVDAANRTVSGFATLDNIDSQGDVVLAEASARAFARARGNIREQHDPHKAVGRMVDFREDEFFYTDPDTGEGKFYRGIFVTARVSEGAPDTWLKVLDGTLSGFSIGGEVIKSSSEYVTEAGKVVKFIEDYELTELSLVDNPANQLANIVSITKSKSGTTMLKGMAAEAVIENVFICPNDETVIVDGGETHVCPMCSSSMECVGWFESVGDRAEKVRSIVQKFLNKEDVQTPLDEGGVEVSTNDELEKEKTDESPAEQPDESVSPEEEVDEPSEGEADAETASDEDEGEPVDVDEVEEDEGDFISKKIDELHVDFKKHLDDTKQETLDKVSQLEARVAEVKETFEAKASELETKIEEFGPKLEAQKSRLADLENRLTKMNSADAFRKSAGVDPQIKDVQNESFWDGAFSG